MLIHSVNPYIRFASPSVLLPNIYIKDRVLYDYELIYIERGSFILKYDGIEYKAGAGDFIFLRPGIQNSFTGIGEEISQPHIHFDFCFNRESDITPVSFKDIPEMTLEERALITKDVFTGYPRSPFVHFSDTKRFFELFYFIISSPADENRLLKKAYLTEIIDMLIKENYHDSFRIRFPRKYGIARQIKDYIDAGTAFEMSLDDFARQFNYSKFYLEKRFKKAYGIGLVAYRNAHRMRLARELLRTESVSAAAEKTGYNSIYSFSRAYKTYYGKSPTDDIKRK